LKKGSSVVYQMKRSSDMLKQNRKGKIYGDNYVFLRRKPRFIRANQIGRPMRKVSNSMADNTLSHLYYEMRLQNKLPGSKKREFRFIKRPWFGPRFKVQSRIGAVHHQNIDDEIFQCFQQDFDN